MNSFNKKFNKIIDDIKLQHKYQVIKDIQRCRNEFFNIKKNDLIVEMNTTTFPIPKKLLSELVDLCYKNNWQYANEFVFNYLIDLIEDSENIDLCKINLEKLKQYRTHCLMFICLPYDLNIWNVKLKRFFSKKQIEKLFKEFDDNPGVSGTYSNGQIIIVNSNYINTLKDAEEIIEHELVHIFEDINEDENIMSQTMQQILMSDGEINTYIINLINSLFALYDHKQTIFTNEIDSKESKKKFLDNMFKNASMTPSVEEFYNIYKKYENSKLLYQNLWFFWNMCRWQSDEFDDFKQKLYKEFNV